MQINIEELSNVKNTVKNSIEHLENAERNLQKIKFTTSNTYSRNIRQMISQLDEIKKDISNYSTWIDRIISDFTRAENASRNAINYTIKSCEEIRTSMQKQQEDTHIDNTGAATGEIKIMASSSIVNGNILYNTNAQLGGILSTIK